MIVYVLFDKVSKQFTPCFEQPTRAAAQRALKKDAAIMASVDDFLIFPLFTKYDLDDVTGSGEIPENFDWFSAIRPVYEKPHPIDLRYFLEIDNRDDKAPKDA